MIKKAVYLEPSPAKINLFLEVIKKREDSYHDIKTLFQAINLQDYITYEIEILSDQSDSVNFHIEIDSNNSIIRDLGLSNSISRAIELYFRALANKTLIDEITQVKMNIFVDKHIPLEAGLAGGSANAASTLRVLNRFFEENFNWAFSQAELLDIALQLGSDVPFCLLSLEKPRLYAVSRGEKFEEKEFKFNYDEFSNLIIVKPDFGISTAWAYQNLDLQNKIKKSQAFYNSFETLVFEAFPELDSIRKKLKQFGANKVLLSGSGSSLIAFADSPEKQSLIYSKAKGFLPESYLLISAKFI